MRQTIWLLSLLGGIALADPRPSLPEKPADILFFGDSVTAGVYNLSLSDKYARLAFSNQVLKSLNIQPDLPRIPEDKPYPLNTERYAEKGLGWFGIIYSKDAISAVLNRKPLFARGVLRSVVAVPGQTLSETLRQSSDNHSSSSAGWVFGRILLPERLTAIETAESSSRKPKWVSLFIGANDLLASFGMVGKATPPKPDEFARDYATLAKRLRKLMDPESPAECMMVGTLPDVTKLPFLQPVLSGAKDRKGNLLPEGTMVSAFVLPFRKGQFAESEFWTPAALEKIQARTDAYNEAIRSLAAREGYSVVEIGELLDEVRKDSSFAKTHSPYFSPDLHHPSHLLHRMIADTILEKMYEVSESEWKPDPAKSTKIGVKLPPSAADLSNRERKNGETVTRVMLLGMQQGYFPPRPSLQGRMELGGQSGAGKLGDGSWAISLQLEGTPVPLTKGWLTRVILGVRAAAIASEDDQPLIPEEARELRLGIGAEPIGRWHWTRLEAGLRYPWSGGLSWYTRGEWRWFYLEGSGNRWAPEKLEVGIQVRNLWGRSGHNGN